jgi:hypothetical protein
MGSNRESFGSGEKKRIEKGKIKIQKKEKIKTSWKKSKLAVLKLYSDPANTIGACPHVFLTIQKKGKIKPPIKIC